MKKEEQKQTAVEICLFLICMSIGLFLFSFFSPDTGGDSQFYLANGREIAENGLAYYGKHLAAPYYWGYPSFLALVLIFVGENYTAMVLIQILFSAISSVFLYRILINDSRDKRICIFAFVLILFYRGIQDVWLWDRMILSDSLGLSLEIMTLYFFWKIKKYRKQMDYFLFFIVSFLFFTMRTNAIVLLVVLCAFLTVDLPEPSRKIVSIVLLLCCGAFLCGICVLGKNEMHGICRRFGYYCDLFRQGTVIYARPQYDVAVSDSAGFLKQIFAFFCVFLKRTCLYWNIFLEDYSLLHKIYNSFVLLPLFSCSLFSGIYLVKKRVHSAYPYLVGVFAYHIVQACTEIDYDMRYRAPVFVLLIIVNMIAITDYLNLNDAS